MEGTSQLQEGFIQHFCCSASPSPAQATAMQPWELPYATAPQLGTKEWWLCGDGCGKVILHLHRTQEEDTRQEG